jgi:hypothetical protein
MKKRPGFKAIVYFLSISFLLMMSGFPGAVAEAKERDLPIGEMVFNGVAKFEARGNVWKGIETSHFPIFRGTKLKVEKGIAFITLSDKSQFEVNSGSLFSFDQEGRLILSQGSIKFRVPADLGVNFKAGSLSIQKSRTLQAARGSSIPSPRNEEALGSISIHSNGSVTVQSIQGSFSILNQDHALLAGLASKETITIPSPTVKGTPKVMIAQAGEGGTGGAGTAGNPSGDGEFLGISNSTWTWVGIGVGVAGAVGGGIAIYSNNKDDDHDRIPLCP